MRSKSLGEKRIPTITKVGYYIEIDGERFEESADTNVGMEQVEMVVAMLIGRAKHQIAKEIKK